MPPTTNSSPDNTVVIPHLNYHGYKRCLETLWEHTPHNFRVILVDQGTHDLWPEVRDYVHCYIRSYRPLGFAKACNLGWRLADTPYVTICNDDVEFIDERWWEGVLGEFGPGVVGVNPKSPRQYVLGTKIQNKFPYKERYEEGDYDRILSLPYNSLQCQAAFCLVLRQDIAKRIGYFDEYFYPAGGEDVDWIIRAKGLRETANRFRGYEVLSTPKSYVWHWWNQSAVDPTFVKARIQLRDKWGDDFDMSVATTRRIIRPPQIRPL